MIVFSFSGSGDLSTLTEKQFSHNIQLIFDLELSYSRIKHNTLKSCLRNVKLIKFRHK